MLNHLHTHTHKTTAGHHAHPAVNGHGHRHSQTSRAIPAPKLATAKGTYSKIFRWHKADAAAQEPHTVEIVGSFTDWQRVPLTHDKVHKNWNLTQHGIESNKTHHYMLLVDGEPAADKNCDGYAIPHGDQEKEFAIQTARGPRLFMLFAQTK